MSSLRFVSMGQAGLTSMIKCFVWINILHQTLITHPLHQLKPSQPISPSLLALKGGKLRELKIAFFRTDMTERSFSDSHQYDRCSRQFFPRELAKSKRRKNLKWALILHETTKSQKEFNIEGQPQTQFIPILSSSLKFNHYEIKLSWSAQHTHHFLPKRTRSLNPWRRCHTQSRRPS